jgi:hypothetical protein
MSRWTIRIFPVRYKHLLCILIVAYVRCLGMAPLFAYLRSRCLAMSVSPWLVSRSLSSNRVICRYVFTSQRNEQDGVRASLQQAVHSGGTLRLYVDYLTGYSDG